MTELPPRNDNDTMTSHADWYADNVSFVERHGFQEKFALSHYESYEGLGGAGATDVLPLSNGFYVVFVESNTPVPERPPAQIGWVWSRGSPSYESRTATALLFDERGSLAGHVSSGAKTDSTKYFIDTFTFNSEMLSMLPSDVAGVIEYIVKQDHALGLKIDKAYRGQGRAEELTMLLFAYIQNKGAKSVVVGTDSTIRTNRDTGEVTSFYKQTGATGPRYETGGWEYNVDEVIRRYDAMLFELLDTEIT